MVHSVPVRCRVGLLLMVVTTAVQSVPVRGSKGLLWEVASCSGAINAGEMQRRLLLATVQHSVPLKGSVGLL